MKTLFAGFCLVFTTLFSFCRVESAIVSNDSSNTLILILWGTCPSEYSATVRTSRSCTSGLAINVEKSSTETDLNCPSFCWQEKKWKSNSGVAEMHLL